MADETARAILEIRATLGDTIKQLQDLKAKLSETTDHARNISQLFSFEKIKEWGRQGVEALAKVAEGIVELGERGTTVQEVSENFDGLSRAAGMTGQAMLGALREGVRGTVSDFDLMKMSNGVLANGLLKTASDAQTLASGAKALGERMGVDTKEAFDTLTRAIETGRGTHLAQYGLTLESTAAIKRYADAHGISTQEVSKHERAVIAAQLVMGQLREQFGAGGGEALRFGEMVEVARSELANFKDALAVAVSTSPVLMAGMRAAGAEIAKAFGGDKTALVSAIVKIIEKLVIGLTYVAEGGVEAAALISLAFNEAKVVFNTVLEALASSQAKVASGLADIAEKASKLPLVGAAMRPIAESLRATADSASSLAIGFGELKTKAQENAVGTLAAMDTAKAAIGRVRDAMRDAGKAHAEAAETAKRSAPAIGGADAAAVAPANAQKIADAFRKLQADIDAIGRTGVDQRIAQAKRAYDEEVAKINQLKQVTSLQQAYMLAAAKARYDKEVEFARLGSDQIQQTRLRLEQTIALAQTSGVQRRLMELDFARQQEIASIEVLKLQYGTKYTELVALISANYAQLTAAAQGHYFSVQQAADASGFQTRAALEQTAATALATYEAMRASGLYTQSEIAAAHQKAEEANREAKGQTKTYTMEADDALLTGAQQMLGILGERNKAAAIAGAIIATYQAVAKALASAPWPANLVLAAGALAAGMANVGKIRSSKAGYAEGTPNLDFSDFGKVSPSFLHGQEAVIPSGGGHKLATEIARALPRAQGADPTMQRLADAVTAIAGRGSGGSQPVQATLNVDGRRLGEVLFDLSRTGAVRIHSMALVTT